MDRDWRDFDRTETAAPLTASRNDNALTCEYNDRMGDGGAAVQSLALVRVADLRPSPIPCPPDGDCDPWADVMAPAE